MKNLSAILLVTCLTAGCANPGVIQLSPDTYMLAREAHGGIFQSTTSLKAGVIEDANEFAEKQGKVAVPISAKEKPMGNGPAQWASFEYQFRVVDKEDPSFKRTQLIHNPNIIIDKQDPDAPINESNTMYDELYKLDDLRKKGILTESEFQDQKSLILKKYAP